MKAFWIILTVIAVVAIIYFVAVKTKKKTSTSVLADANADGKVYGDDLGLVIYGSKNAECNSNSDCGSQGKCVNGFCEDASISTNFVTPRLGGFNQVPYSQVGSYFQSPHFTQPVVSNLENYMSGKVGK